jgi:hypothetical protein
MEDSSAHRVLPEMKVRLPFQSISDQDFRFKSGLINSKADWWDEWLQKTNQETGRKNSFDVFLNAFDFYSRYKSRQKNDGIPIPRWALVVELNPTPEVEVKFSALSQVLIDMSSSAQVRGYLAEPIDESRFLLILSHGEFVFTFIKHHRPINWMMQYPNDFSGVIEMILKFPYLATIPYTGILCDDVVKK